MVGYNKDTKNTRSTKVPFTDDFVPFAFFVPLW